MTPTQRERAEAAFGHLQKAATEMILAAHQALEIVDESVSGADLGGILNRLGALASLAGTRPRPTARPAEEPGPPARHRGVERISIR